MDYIDYSGEDTSASPESWGPTQFRKYFEELYWKVHKVGGFSLWTAKEWQLLKRMRAEFTGSDLADLMVYWHTNHPAQQTMWFNSFYSRRAELYQRMIKARGDYSWD